MHTLRTVVAAVLIFGIQRFSGAVTVGDRPQYQFKSTTGQTITDENMRGRMVLIDFWATWCGPCMNEAEHMVQIHRKYGPLGLQIIGVSLDTNAGKMSRVVKEKGFAWPQIYEGKAWDNPLLPPWGIKGIPATFLISPDGELIWSGHPANIDVPLAEAFKKYGSKLKKRNTGDSLRETIGEALTGVTKRNDYAEALSLIQDFPNAVINNRETAEDAASLVAAYRFPRDEEAKLAATEALSTNEAGAKVIAGFEATILANNAFGPTKQPATGKPATTSPDDLVSKDKTDTDTEDASIPVESTNSSRNAAAISHAMFNSADRRKTAGDHVAAYRQFKATAAQFPATPSGRKAVLRVNAYERDKRFIDAYRAAAGEKEAIEIMNTAASYEKTGKHEQAIPLYQEIIEKYPETATALKARKALEKK